ncbi:MAG: flagellin, partial [Pseudomonadota bacterium]
MASFINTNLSALTAQRNLAMSQSTLQTTMQRLSSGLRINSAKDDAAGLAISDRFSAQITGLNQASRNANDGISMAQTAEGALGQVTTSLQRLRELAVQSSNASNSDSDRAALNQEAQQLLTEVNRVGTQTQFNGTNLLDGSFKDQTFQIGANAGQTMSISMNSATIDKLGVSDTSSVTAMATNAGIASGDLVVNGVMIGASAASYDNKSYPDNFKSASSIAKAAAINAVSDKTGVAATADVNVAKGSQMAAGVVSVGVIVINGVATGSISTTSDTSVSRAAVVKAINALSDRTGVTAVDTGDDNSGVQLVAKDGRNITVTSSTASLTNTALGLRSFGTDTGTYTLSSAKKITVQEGTQVGGLANTGLASGTFSTQTAYVSTTAGSAQTIGAGDFKVNGILVGASLAKSDTASSTGNTASAIAKAAAINAIKDLTGVTATANANAVKGQAVVAAKSSGVIVINGATT